VRSRSVGDAVEHFRKIIGTRLAVLFAIRKHEKKKGKACWAKRKTLGGQIGRSERVVSRTLSELTEWGYIFRSQKRRRNKKGQWITSTNRLKIRNWGKDLLHQIEKLLAGAPQIGVHKIKELINKVPLQLILQKKAEEPTVSAAALHRNPILADWLARGESKNE